jgi:hypothetical protein
MNIGALFFVNDEFKPVYRNETKSSYADKFIYYKHKTRANGVHRFQFLDGYSKDDDDKGKYFLFKKKHE